ncbi:type IV secretion system protein VirB6/type IV secretion system protein TrbL [Pseudomonas duriflava]|uniref:Type IV secretion system protein VirB6/type IV secretion system protein TrbL n=1 Tax=Pseudomonas duriflava TaxID=459528 RepID=A0A562PP25_9PSED|nr:P-type conjugative transfer protein TrbL [Pseudomonas duriflava]TWI46169.1 type IV secretion system protein VirB6/type IV secretion system protein TrbL [Pseudomonas duriflava]
MRMSVNWKIAAIPLFIWLAFYSIDANAAINNGEMLNSVLQKYSDASEKWAVVITAAASRLFWTLTVISMCWTFGLLALRKADIGEFFTEATKFIIFTGFFWWLLVNGPDIAESFINSLKELGASAAGLNTSTKSIAPSGIIDVGFEIFYKICEQFSGWSPVMSACLFIEAIIILAILAIVAVNMLILLISAWVLSYAGIFFLGFGGSRWTSDIAINYYKTILGISAQLFTMVLIVGVAKTFLMDYANNMSEEITLAEMGVVLVAALILLLLVDKLPGMVAGIVGGAGAGAGTSFGAGAAIGAMGAAAAAMATSGAMMASAAKGIAANAQGGGQALAAAFKAASAGEGGAAGGSASQLLSATNSIYGGGDSPSSSSSSSTPLSEAMGFGGTSSGGGEGGGSSSSGSESDGGSFSGGESGAGSSSGGESGGGSSSGGESGIGSSSGGESGIGSSSGGESGGSSAGSKIAQAARIGLGTASNLAKGVGQMANNKKNELKDSWNESVSKTAGGKLAAEINNPGGKARERSEDQLLAKYDAAKASEDRSERLAKANDYFSSSTVDGNNSIGPSSSDLDDEINEFVNRA